MSLEAITILNGLKAFLKEAGELGIAIQKTAAQSEKEDYSIVTEADIAISNLFQKCFAEYLSQPGHMLIDEEVKKNPRDEVLAADYQWIIDPIDGTATYAGGGFFWGIIVSVYRKGEPWVAATYIPAMRLLYWADESNAHETRDAFTEHDKTTLLKAASRPLTRSSQVHMHYEFVKETFAETPFILVDYWSPLHGGMAAAGRIACSVFKDSVWDFSAGMVFATRVGYKMRRIADGKTFTRLNSELITPEWKLANLMFIGPDETYAALKPHFHPDLTVATQH